MATRVRETAMARFFSHAGEKCRPVYLPRYDGFRAGVKGEVYREDATRDVPSGALAASDRRVPRLIPQSVMRICRRTSGTKVPV